MNRSTVTQLLLTLTFCTLPVFGQSPAKAGNAENGKKVYIADGCFQCHGLQGQGGASAPVGSYGPRLAPPKLPVAALRAYVRQPSGGMPPYTSKVLSDSQIDDIYAFLKTVPAPAPVKDIPLLNQ
jgi:mono/diheme cytochrome c family protein